jgi:DNA-binding response OmpR family regulator
MQRCAISFGQVMRQSVSSRRNVQPLRSTVLLVESHEDTCEMYAECLRMWGFTVLTAHTADEGSRFASEADVIVTEIRVSGSFDGVDLVSRLRHSDDTKQTPVIVLTSCAFEQDRQRAYAAGCDVFMPKPCLPEHLVSAIEGVVGTTLGQKSSWKNQSGDEPTTSS